MSGDAARPGNDVSAAIGGGRPGRLPWTGTRARSRELGYAQAMCEMFHVLAEITRERPYLEPHLGPVREYAFNAWSVFDDDMFRWSLNRNGMRPGTRDEVTR